MSIFVIFLIIIILIGTIIGLLAHFKYFKVYTPIVVDPSEYMARYNIQAPWSENVPVTNEDEDNTLLGSKSDVGKCQIYTFTNLDNPSLPAQPALQKIKKGLGKNVTLANNDNSCVDDDQIFAQKFTHTCQHDTVEFIANSTAGCLTRDGRVVPNKSVEKYYGFCVPDDVDTTLQDARHRCPGALSLLSLCQVGLSVNPVGGLDDDIKKYHRCIVSNPNASSFSLGLCQPGDSNQLFRVTRANYVNAIEGYKINPSGLFAKIVHRDTGKCIIPVSNITDVITSLPPEDFCLSQHKEYNLGAIDCNLGNDEGYWWVLSPPIPHLKTIIGDGQSLSTYVNSPQQFVYIKTPPLTLNTSDPSEMISYLSTKCSIQPAEVPTFRLVSKNTGGGPFFEMRPLSNSNGRVIVDTFKTNSDTANPMMDSKGGILTPNFEVIATGQYIDYSLYTLFSGMPTQGKNSDSDGTISF